MDAKAGGIVETILGALRTGKAERAVRALLQGVSHGQVPDNGKLLGWLRRNLGVAGARRQLWALAVHPCFYCKNGLQACDHCEGKGQFDRSYLCRYCLGLGVASCDFCNGSGLATYTIVPAPVRAHVVELRVRHALRQAEALLKAAAATDRQRPAGSARRGQFNLLFGLDRLMGTLENAVVALNELSRSDRKTRPRAARTLKLCRRAAKRIDKNMRDILGKLETLERAGLAKATPGTARSLVEQRADLFAELRNRPGFHDSTLKHPFLKLGAGRR